MSPECVCEVLAQNTHRSFVYTLLKLQLLGYEPKCTVFVCVFKYKKLAGAPGPFQNSAKL